MRGAWIEMQLPPEFLASLPVRGAWIEIRLCILVAKNTAVAPCEGSVD